MIASSTGGRRRGSPRYCVNCGFPHAEPCPSPTAIVAATASIRAGWSEEDHRAHAASCPAIGGRLYLTPEAEVTIPNLAWHGPRDGFAPAMLPPIAPYRLGDEPPDD